MHAVLIKKDIINLRQFEDETFNQHVNLKFLVCGNSPKIEKRALRAGTGPR